MRAKADQCISLLVTHSSGAVIQIKSCRQDFIIHFVTAYARMQMAKVSLVLDPEVLPKIRWQVS